MLILFYRLQQILHRHQLFILRIAFGILLFGVVILSAGYYLPLQAIKHQQQQNRSLTQQFQKVKKQFTALKTVDQYKRNEELQATMSAMQKTFSQTVDEYQQLEDLKQSLKDVSSYDTIFAEILKYLSDKNYASAASDLTTLSQDITSEQQKLAAAAVPATSAGINVASSNNPPGSGYQRQSVTADTGTFTLDIIAADLNSTRVIVDTASDGDCSNNCPAFPLAEYANRSGAYAAINGTFFCPPEYPQCAGKTNSFDTLLMNKNKVYFNSANNVYSSVPLVYFSGNQMGVRGASSDWGRTTDVDSVIAMQPLLVSGSNIVYGSSSDSKFTNKGTRDFIANRGNTVYIGVIYNANMTDSAHVLKALGMETALNLDEGGSTALWMNGSYIAGPGRNIPNAVLFVHK